MKSAKFLGALLMIITGCSESDNGNETAFANGHWIDLSYSFSDSTLYWPNNPTGFQLDTQTNGVTTGGFYYASNAFCAPEHGGTHLDAPRHFAAGKQTADQIPLEHLTGPAIVVDVSDKALRNRDYLVSVSDLENWEKLMAQFRTDPLCYFVQVMDGFILMQKNISVQTQKALQPFPFCISRLLALKPQNGSLFKER